MNSNKGVVALAETRLAQLMHEGLATGLGIAMGGGEEKIFVAITAQTNVQAPDFDRSRIEAIRARLRDALQETPFQILGEYDVSPPGEDICDRPPMPIKPAPGTPSQTEPSLQAGHGSTHKPIETAGRPSEHIAGTLICLAEEGESAQHQVTDAESQSCSKVIEGSPINLTSLDLVAEIHANDPTLLQSAHGFSIDPHTSDQAPGASEPARVDVAESSATDKEIETQDKPRDWLMPSAVKDVGAAAEEHTSEAVEKTEAGHRALADTSARVSPMKVADRTLGARQEPPADPVRVGQRAAGGSRARGVLYSALTGAAAVLLAGIWVYNAGPHLWVSHPLAPSATAADAHPPADLATTGTGQLGEPSASSRTATASKPGTISGVPEVVDRESRPAKRIPPAQPGPAAEARVEEASITPTATPVLEGARLQEAPSAVAPVPADVRLDEALTAAASGAATRPGLGLDKVAAYMAQARHKIEQGDIAAARRLLERASGSDKAEVWFALAETYDPKMLAQWGVLGVKPDLEKARALYRNARAFGDQGARERLLALRE